MTVQDTLTHRDYICMILSLLNDGTDAHRNSTKLGNVPCQQCETRFVLIVIGSAGLAMSLLHPDTLIFVNFSFVFSLCSYLHDCWIKMMCVKLR